MTITKEQGKEAFSQAAAWEITFVRQPETPAAMLGLFEHPRILKAAADIINQIGRERRKPPSKPTLCMLCDNNFLKQWPHMVVIMNPATRKGPAIAFFLCCNCDTVDYEQKVRAKLFKSLGAITTEWGNT